MGSMNADSGALILPRNEQDSEYPAVLLRAGKNAAFAADEFFSAMLANPHTRRAYRRAVSRFLSWCDGQAIELSRVTPGDAGRYIGELAALVSTQVQAVAALRKFFDVLTLRHVVPLNPFVSVRAQRFQVIEGRTREITQGQARQLLGSFDLSRGAGLRDRAIVGTLAYTGTRVGAIVRLRCRDFIEQGNGGYELRFQEKGGKQRTIPVRHDLADWLLAYQDAAGTRYADGAEPFFRGVQNRSGIISRSGLSTSAVRLMLKRRLRQAGLPPTISPHSFRVYVVTDLLGQGVPVEQVQYLVGHTSQRTTALYDRRGRRVSRNIVERITI